jgi:hypothetical protein
LLDLLSGLVERSWVVVEHDADHTRYRLLETLHVYARGGGCCDARRFVRVSDSTVPGNGSSPSIVSGGALFRDRPELIPWWSAAAAPNQGA